MDPNSPNRTALWASYNYTSIDDSVRPSSAGDGVYCHAVKADDGDWQEWNVERSFSMPANEEVQTAYVQARARAVTVSGSLYLISKMYDSYNGWASQRNLSLALSTSWTWYTSANTTGLNLQSNAEIDSMLLSLSGQNIVGVSDEVQVDVSYITVITTSAFPGNVPTLTHSYNPTTHVARFTRGIAAQPHNTYVWDIYYSGSWHNNYYVGGSTTLDYNVIKGDEYDCRVRARNRAYYSLVYTYASGHPWTQYWNINTINGVPFGNIDEINDVPAEDIDEINGVEFY